MEAKITFRIKKDESNKVDKQLQIKIMLLSLEVKNLGWWLILLKLINRSFASSRIVCLDAKKKQIPSVQLSAFYKTEM